MKSASRDRARRSGLAGVVALMHVAGVASAGGAASDVEALSQDLRASSAEARALEHLDPSSLPAIATKLAALRAVQVDVAPLLRAAAPPVRPDAGDVDRVPGLLHAPPSGEAYDVAVTTLVLARALAEQATPESLRELLRIVPDHDGAFRAQVERIFGEAGERAIPVLLTARDDSNVDLRRFAAATLESLGKSRPSEQVQLRDEGALTDTLRAFGVTRDLDALNVLMSFINASRAAVREAARVAVVDYGDAGVPKLREAYANLTGNDPSHNARAAQLAADLFEAADRIRMRELYALLDTGLARQAQGDVAGAIATFDKILAREPAFSERQRMVPTYLGRGRALEDVDPDAAAAALRQAARLRPGDSEASAIASELAYLDATSLATRGLTDPALLRASIALNPENARAVAALANLENAARDRHRRLVRWGSCAGCSLLFALLLLFATPWPLRGRRKGQGQRSA